MNPSTTHKRHPRRTREQWQQSIKDFEQSHLSTADFCKQHQLAYSSFAKWRSILNQENQKAPAFVDITPTLPVPTSSETDWTVELAIGDQIVLRIR